MFLNNPKILFIYRSSLIVDALKDISSSQHPKDFLYGLDRLLSQKDLNVDWINIKKGKRDTLARKLFYFIEKPFSLFTKLGMPLEIYFENKKKIRESEVIICVNDAISLSLLFAKMLGLVKGRVFILIQSLPERLKYFRRNKPLIFFIQRLLSKADLVLTLSDCAKRPLVTTFKVPAKKLLSFYFGADLNYWKAASGIKRKDFILSVGNDFNRDYETLVRTAPPDRRLVIVTKKKIDFRGKKNIRVVSDIPDRFLRHLYRSCSLVVIPSVKIKRESSGLSCALQAMACGAPVLLSDSPPMREYFKEDKHVFFYRPEDAEDLKNKIVMVLSDPVSCASKAQTEAQGLIFRKFTTRRMAGTWHDIFKGKS